MAFSTTRAKREPRVTVEFDCWRGHCLSRSSRRSQGISPLVLLALVQAVVRTFSLAGLPALDDPPSRFAPIRPRRRHAHGAHICDELSHVLVHVRQSSHVDPADRRPLAEEYIQRSNSASGACVNAARTASSDLLSNAVTPALSVMLFSKLSFFAIIVIMRETVPPSSLPYKSGAAATPVIPSKRRLPAATCTKTSLTDRAVSAGRHP